MGSQGMEAYNALAPRPPASCDVISQLKCHLIYVAHGCAWICTAMEMYGYQWNKNDVSEVCKELVTKDTGD